MWNQTSAVFFWCNVSETFKYDDELKAEFEFSQTGSLLLFIKNKVKELCKTYLSNLVVVKTTFARNLVVDAQPATR